ncbi:DUF3710 domain-containing protein [Nocardioides sambongensis]|uniref:DUF3710 domain-containing protein n=1 Tax=Nocardioides sambongensis TaxID=2589074 RepID=UPI001E3D6795|nr:DUF3710 domain-containing protein [Nocardioides sambongensis]
MRLRRKANQAEETTSVDAESTDSTGAAGEDQAAGPLDVDEVPADQHPPLDLGALLLAPSPGRDLRVQVDEKSGTVRAVLLADQSGAVELRAFAAPRNGDLWSEVRPQIAADTARRGGTATEREGRFGTELVCEVQVKRSDGAQGTQVSRVVGVNGPRWLLRATFLGEPARDAAAAAAWDDTLNGVVVRRGDHAMPVGEQLPLALPEGIERADKPAG